ncbi:MAG: hypothetical protein K0R47_130 [Brevibacillus sp.]|nr:hypothetical protein [Brevibacillus sp.]
MDIVMMAAADPGGVHPPIIQMEAKSTRAVPLV